MKPLVGTLSSLLMPPIRIVKKKKPIDIHKLDNGHYVFDFGENGAGFTKLFLPSDTPAGTHVILRHAEILFNNGSIQNTYYPCYAPLHGGNCANQSDLYISKGAKNEVYMPRFILFLPFYFFPS